MPIREAYRPVEVTQALVYAGTTRRTPREVSEVIRHLRSSFGFHTDASAEHRKYSFADAMRLLCALEHMDGGLSARNVSRAVSRASAHFAEVAKEYCKDPQYIRDKRPIVRLHLDPLTWRENEKTFFEDLPAFQKFQRECVTHIPVVDVDMGALAHRAQLRMSHYEVGMAAQALEKE